MKKPKFEHLLAIGLIIGFLLSSIPFTQTVEVTKTKEYTSDNGYHIEVGFGGSKYTWVVVECNRTSEIRFMYQSGVWFSTHNVLLKSTTSTISRFNFNGNYSTNVVEIISDGPISARILYTYYIETEASLFGRFLYSLGVFDPY